MRKSVLALLFLCWFFTIPLSGRELMLPEMYEGDIDVEGWLLSEKYDGVRGCWTGKELLSKNGVQLHPPLTFIEGLPPFAIEGELWAGRGAFTKTVSIVNKESPHDGWLELQFAIFDVPGAGGGFLERIEKAKQWFTKHPSKFAFVIEQKVIEGPSDIDRELQRVSALGGEGLVIRTPDGIYKDGRSTDILKVKTYQDAEAKVIGHLPGKGRNEGRLGALLVEEKDGTRFRIGGGFSDGERENPPAVDTTITFKYYGRYPSGIPKFPSFLRVRGDAGL